MYVWVDAYMGTKLQTRLYTRHGCHCLLSASIFEGPCLTHMADWSHDWLSNYYIVVWPGLKEKPDQAKSFANLEHGYRDRKSITHRCWSWKSLWIWNQITTATFKVNLRKEVAGTQGVIKPPDTLISACGVHFPLWILTLCFFMVSDFTSFEFAYSFPCRSANEAFHHCHSNAPVIS